MAVTSFSDLFLPFGVDKVIADNINGRSPSTGMFDGEHKVAELLSWHCIQVFFRKGIFTSRARFYTRAVVKAG